MLINSPYVLVVGGAGYIGSHMVLMLQQAGFQPVVLDNLSKGYRDAVMDAEFVHGDMGNKPGLEALFDKYAFAAVMHFGSFIEVAESVRCPAKYYQNNVAATLNLLDVMLAYQVKNFIFSSTAAVYGEPHYTPIDERHPISPVNPYGHSKRMVEQVLHDYGHINHLRFASLRYFNAAGADPHGRVRERHEPESHLIPLILQVAQGVRDHIAIYGADYPTPDGTCIRDFVHVSDLCRAHLLALQHLLYGKDSIICNLGTGQGYSVRQVVDAIQRVTGHTIPIVTAPRRAGDPAILVADASLAQRLLQWQPQYQLTDMIQHAWSACVGPSDDSSLSHLFDVNYLGNP
jgi:UDP-glucose 4-epimerase